MPPLALPAAGYWLAMGALTYVFAHLGPHPLEPTQAIASERDSEQPEAPPAFEHPAVPETVTSPTQPLAELPAPTEAVPPPAPEPAPVVADEREPEHEHEIRENRKAGRREGFLGSSSDEPEPPKPDAPRVAMSFPEFTDSSRAPKRERAADGPRIDSLFERAPATDLPPKDAAPDAPPPPANDPDAPAVAASCEAAIARNNEQLTIGAARGAPDISREAYASILQNGRYLSGCSLPERTVFEICAAVKDGHAIGITVVSTPPSSKLNACVRRAVAHLKFPQNSRMDVTHTRFDAASR